MLFRSAPFGKPPVQRHLAALEAFDPHARTGGLALAAATRLLGIAAERTEEPPATVWRYKAATCELDLFFYLDLRSGRMRTLHYTFKGEADDAARRQNCLKELVGTRGS